MNKPTLNKRLAMNYAILKAIVQDDDLLDQTLNRSNIQELIDVEAFYQRYLNHQRFIENHPTVFKLLTRQTQQSFKQLRKYTKILHRFDAQYPVAIRQDFKDKAPMFIYVHGDLYTLDRKRHLAAVITTIKDDKTYLTSAKAVVEQVVQSPYLPLLQNRSMADGTLIHTLDKRQIPYVLLINQPIYKRSPLETEQENHKTILSFIGPMDGVMVDFQRLKIMNSLAKVTILISDQPNDVHHFSIQNNLAWHKPSILPLVQPDQALHFDGLTLLQSPQDLHHTLTELR